MRDGDSDTIVDDARRFLRSCSTGDLQFDEHLDAVRFVITHEGKLVLPVMVAVLLADDTVLFVPSQSEAPMELLVTPMPFDDKGPDGALIDRWRIYHGEPQDTNWVAMDIETARYAGHIIDGDALMCPNPLATDEAAICTEVNRDRRDALAAICTAHAGVDIEDPRLVGVDPIGFDVRARFGIVRIPVTDPMTDADAVRRSFDALAAD